MSADRAPGQRNVVLLLGPPGAGKGTQARFLSEVLGVPHIASGDLLREHRRRGTELGRKAQAYMDAGDLVPDALVVDMVMARFDQSDAARGALLDGFPRNLAQAEVLDTSLGARGEAVRTALYLDVPKKILVERLSGRWICRDCQTTYHERFNPPSVPGLCDVCGGELYQRTDDRRDVVENRADVYLRETTPVIDHYDALGVLHRIDGDRPVEEVRAQLCAALGGAVRGHRRNRWHLYIGSPTSPNRRHGRLGRTLCGKVVWRDSGQEMGDAETFDALPCRACWRELRPHMKPASGPARAEEAV